VFYRLTLSIVAVLAVSSVGRASDIDGHYSGKARGTTKGSGAEGNPCLDLNVDMTIAAGRVSGTTERLTPSVRGSFQADRQRLSGQVLADDSTTKLTLYGRSFTATVANNRVIGKFVGVACDYNFDIPRSQ